MLSALMSEGNILGEFISSGGWLQRVYVAESGLVSDVLTGMTRSAAKRAEFGCRWRDCGKNSQSLDVGGSRNDKSDGDDIDDAIFGAIGANDTLSCMYVDAGAEPGAELGLIPVPAVLAPGPVSYTHLTLPTILLV